MNEKEEEGEKERAGDGLEIVHIHQPPPCCEKKGERLGSIITDSVAMETDWLQRVGFV